MNIKRERAPIRKSRLENEVILAVVILYVLLSAAMLLIHHLQPDDVATKTSSTAPAHEYFSDDADRESADTTAPDVARVQALLDRAGYRDVRELHREGTRYRAIASKDGRTWQLDLELPPPLLTATPLTP